jgi:hypothetical protein
LVVKLLFSSAFLAAVLKCYLLQVSAVALVASICKLSFTLLVIVILMLTKFYHYYKDRQTCEITTVFIFIQKNTFFNTNVFDTSSIWHVIYLTRHLLQKCHCSCNTTNKMSKFRSFLGKLSIFLRRGSG